MSSESRYFACGDGGAGEPSRPPAAAASVDRAGGLPDRAVALADWAAPLADCGAAGRLGGAAECRRQGHQRSLQERPLPPTQTASGSVASRVFNVGGGGGAVSPMCTRTA